MLEFGAVGGFVSVFAVALPFFDFQLTHPVAGLAVTAGILFSFHGATAVAVGYIVGKFAIGSLYLGSVLAAFAYFVVGGVSAVVWCKGCANSNRSGYKRGLGYARLFVGTMSVAALSGGVVLAWGYEVFGLFPFFLATRYVFSFGLASLLIAPPVLLVSMFALDRDAAIARTTDNPAENSLWTIGVLALTWLIVGTIGSVGYRAVTVLLSQYPEVFTTRDLEILLVIHGDSVYGPGGQRIQAIFGGIMFLLLMLTLVHSETTVNWWRLGKEEGDDA